jgi:hypothetical protein
MFPVALVKGKKQMKKMGRVAVLSKKKNDKRTTTHLAHVLRKLQTPDVIFSVLEIIGVSDGAKKPSSFKQMRQKNSASTAAYLCLPIPLRRRMKKHQQKSGATEPHLGLRYFSSFHRTLNN